MNVGCESVFNQTDEVLASKDEAPKLPVELLYVLPQLPVPEVQSQDRVERHLAFMLDRVAQVKIWRCLVRIVTLQVTN